MRIATWNVNSLRARLEKVQWWLDRARPDVLLMQETKLADAEAPAAAFRDAGYELVHHGQGQWNGVAIASRVGAQQVTKNFGLGVEVAARGAEDQVNPFGEARMVGAMCGDVFAVCLYAPNGRVVDSPHYAAKLEWFQRLSQWLEEAGAGKNIVLGGDFNVAPADIDVWDPAATQGGTHVTAPERSAFRKLCQLGLTDIYRAQHPEAGRYTWWDYRGGNFHRNIGMRIDHLLISAP
ncbi:MAG TPA: exodeoxyribonuclease III, partial [Spirochaetia bacterium]|nr:exodeoxyribonuclease III [Spirochaetia bacterium]